MLWPPSFSHVSFSVSFVPLSLVSFATRSPLHDAHSLHASSILSQYYVADAIGSDSYSIFGVDVASSARQAVTILLAPLLIGALISSVVSGLASGMMACLVYFVSVAFPLFFVCSSLMHLLCVLGVHCIEHTLRHTAELPCFTVIVCHCACASCSLHSPLLCSLTLLCAAFTFYVLRGFLCRVRSLSDASMRFFVCCLSCFVCLLSRVLTLSLSSCAFFPCSQIAEVASVRCLCTPVA